MGFRIRHILFPSMANIILKPCTCSANAYTWHFVGAENKVCHLWASVLETFNVNLLPSIAKMFFKPCTVSADAYT